MDDWIDVSAMLGPGVYALRAKGVVIYIGQAKRLYSRVYAHRYNWAAKQKGRNQDWLGIRGFAFDEVLVFPCPLHRLAGLEREMIARYQPRYNITMRNARSTEEFTIKVAGKEIVVNAKPKTIGLERRV